MKNNGYDIIVVGAGIVGLATAYRLLEKRPGLKIAILEKEEKVAQHQSGHNSGVIHSGIYYTPGSMKAKNCISGYRTLLEFCDQHSIPYEICGKIIVATNEGELPALDNLYHKGISNGLDGIRYISGEEIKDIEPHVLGIRGIHVPQTGIINYTTVCNTLSSLLKNSGADIYFGQKVTGIKETTSSIEVTTSTDMSMKGQILINCTGLHSDRLSALSMPVPGFRIIPFRGEYYQLKPEKEYLVRHLIYPVPDPSFPFLGAHFTRMIAGGIEAGPNAVLAFAKEGYNWSDINVRELYSFFAYPGFRKLVKKYWRTGLDEMYRSLSKGAFVAALQKLIPDIREEDIVRAGSGVRAQACNDSGNLIEDFYFQQTKRTLHICNAPSPAATSCLSIGDNISDELLKNYSL